MSARAALIVGILVVLAGCSEPTAAERAAEQARWDAEAARQPERKALIEKLQREDLIGRVEWRDSACTLWVGPRFRALTFEEKQSFAGVVAAYGATERRDEGYLVRLHDLHSGRQIGSYCLGRLELD